MKKLIAIIFTVLLTACNQGLTPESIDVDVGLQEKSYVLGQELKYYSLIDGQWQWMKADGRDCVSGLLYDVIDNADGTQSIAGITGSDGLAVTCETPSKVVTELVLNVSPIYD